MAEMHFSWIRFAAPNQYRGTSHCWAKFLSSSRGLVKHRWTRVREWESAQSIIAARSPSATRGYLLALEGVVTACRRAVHMLASGRQGLYPRPSSWWMAAELPSTAAA